MTDKLARICLTLFTVLLSILVLGGPARADADDGAYVISATRNGRIVDLTIQSPALQGTGKARLLLPTGWDAQPDRTWPVLYLLHGAGADQTAWTTQTSAGYLTGLVGNTGVLVVMPDGGKCGAYSDWLSGPGWETFHLTELRQILERAYRAGSERAVAGYSMGGFGAMSYAARHPGFFKGAVALSGAVDTRLATTVPGQPFIDGPTLVKQAINLNCFGTPWQNLWGDDGAPGWAAHNPYDLAPYLTSTYLYVWSGDGNCGGCVFNPVEQSTRYQSEAFVRRLTALGIPVTAHFGTGDHSFTYWEPEFQAAFPSLMTSIGAS